MKKSRIASALVVVSASLGFATVTAIPAHALGKIKCDMAYNASGTRYELPRGSDVAVFVGDLDPIVRHNEVGAPHTHDFFGAQDWQATLGNTANYSDLVSSRTSCRLVGDTAGYWTPVMKYISGPLAGQRVKVIQFTAYYRGFNGQTTHAGSQAFPADVRLIAEDMVGKGLSGWTCGQNSTVTGGQNSIPDCSNSGGGPGDTLTAHINYPSCWNGNPPNHSSSEVGDTRDNADWTYPARTATQCPSTHPIEVIQLRQTIQYDYIGNGTDVALVSDSHNGTTDGQSMHGDFWNTWNQDELVSFVQRCINTSAEANCAP